jgi:hypothetical protein
MAKIPKMTVHNFLGANLPGSTNYTNHSSPALLLLRTQYIKKQWTNTVSIFTRAAVCAALDWGWFTDLGLAAMR